MLALGAWHLHVARHRHVFDLQAMESRFAIAGRYAARALPPQAVVLAVQQSGSVRYYGGTRRRSRGTRFRPDALDSTLAALRAAGRPPFIALEDAEEPRFRARFATRSASGALDWPPFGRSSRRRCGCGFSIRMGVTTTGEGCRAATEIIR